MNSHDPNTQPEHHDELESPIFIPSRRAMKIFWLVVIVFLGLCLYLIMTSIR